MEANADARTNRIRTRDKYVHLYLPLITALLILKNGHIISKSANPNNDWPQGTLLFTALSAIPTYVVGSYMYPPNLPEATPEQFARFTRKHDAFRALVLATYNRLPGTPFNLQSLIADFILSYVAGYIVGERLAGTRQRRSELLTVLPWLVASSIGKSQIPSTMETLWFFATTIDGILWRAAYLALVDDVIRVLSHPNVKTLRGKATLVFAQSFTITTLVWFVLSWYASFNARPLRASKVL